MLLGTKHHPHEKDERKTNNNNLRTDGSIEFHIHHFNRAGLEFKLYLFYGVSRYKFALSV
jgi:hypothetical protein